jgi:hypothetical protein
MRAFTLSLTAIAAVCLLPISAQAQFRVFVSAQGSDSNPCTFALPCRSFQHAHDTVSFGGEIDVLDPAGYGALTISKSISIQGHGFAGITATSGTAITIPGLSNVVNLRGLLIDGVGSGSNGITMQSNVGVNIQDCLIRNFSNAGILVDAAVGSIRRNPRSPPTRPVSMCPVPAPWRDSTAPRSLQTASDL